MAPGPRWGPGPPPSSPSSLRVAGLQERATAPSWPGGACVRAAARLPLPARAHAARRGAAARTNAVIIVIIITKCRSSPGSVAEWSMALVLGTSLFRGVGSNPTAASSPYFMRTPSIHPSIHSCLPCPGLALAAQAAQVPKCQDGTAATLGLHFDCTRDAQDVGAAAAYGAASGAAYGAPAPHAPPPADEPGHLRRQSIGLI